MNGPTASCTIVTLGLSKNPYCAFSILERIEWAATVAFLPADVREHAFQYPRTDRMGCDGVVKYGHFAVAFSFSILERIEWAATQNLDDTIRRPKGLSVSSNGSNGLRHFLNGAMSSEQQSFSILERIEWAATRTTPSGKRSNSCLSVSSNGSNGLRPEPRLTAVRQKRNFQYPRTDRMGCDSRRSQSTKEGTNFQYPRTDRMGCDSTTRSCTTNSMSLSVSSNGSNGLRPQTSQRREQWDVTFSILERIEWAATIMPRVEEKSIALPFSILERIEWAATCQVKPSRTTSLSPFSILERIEWAATLAIAVQDSLHVVFQYPRTDRMGCDTAPPMGEGTLQPFQYPRTDRMGCDCDPRMACTTSAHQLSVSSNGSNGLRHPDGVHASSPPTFQYPRTDRMGCDALAARSRRASPRSFQYPRTDRMGCDSPCQRMPVSIESLSVSSNGSNGLRRVAAPCRATCSRLSVSSNGSNGLRLVRLRPSSRASSTFSILERIEWAATHIMWSPSAALPRLSVSSNGSNGLRPPSGRQTSRQRGTFSILERIEWAATAVRRPHPVQVGVPFSILERIEWAATAGLHRHPEGVGRFQYPRTDRMGCDPSRWRSSRPASPLSVSSNGSNGLRRGQ